MSETMMAFLAMMLMMFFSLSQNESIVELQREAANVEYEIMANAIAAQTMQYIAATPFDARINDGTVTLQNLDVNLLTPPSNFPVGANPTDETETALEFFNQMQPQIDYFPIDPASQDTLLSGLPFTIQAVVHYIDADGEISNVPTWTKEVTLFVEQLTAPGEEPYLRRPVIKTRRFSPRWES